MMTALIYIGLTLLVCVIVGFVLAALDLRRLTRELERERNERDLLQSLTQAHGAPVHTVGRYELTPEGLRIAEAIRAEDRAREERDRESARTSPTQSA